MYVILLYQAVCDLLSCFIMLVAVVHRRHSTNVSQWVMDGCVVHGHSIRKESYILLLFPVQLIHHPSSADIKQ